MTVSIGVVVDNDFVSDVRVQKEVDILQKNGFQVHVLCFGFDGKQYEEPKGVSISLIPIKKSKKNSMFFFFNRQNASQIRVSTPRGNKIHTAQLGQCSGLYNIWAGWQDRQEARTVGLNSFDGSTAPDLSRSYIKHKNSHSAT